ncbi:Crp/Fnr family transcriptional regulator [Dyadobacter psychrophilus]|uniref:cAMP-binding domain of CRP or a regulatory subunit of cAMP-dependent protein kinases n=1 Tax=Dyadobacter psychrophilus TaxID=651661 RepID=A0A1T5FSQ2_9BACT|nr:Crp/Fnr family transcriptional regulator [Dyadobacter psychrophilus]SKB99205.1 cAMP-binding domain of CRP or a regulatory subunit of cAMP-dependent protein kinases [Dyadobacter psychrophilus]
MDSDIQFLASYIKQTISIEPEKAIAIASKFRKKEWVKGDVFLKEGAISDEYLLLERGFMRSYLFDVDGNEITLNFFSQKTPVFEVGSFFQRIPSQENMEALTDAAGWVLSFNELNGLFHAIPEFREFGRAVLVKGFVAFKNRTLSMINKTADQRYEALLYSNPEIFQNASLKHIASYLGVTDTSLSRIRKKFSQK